MSVVRAAMKITTSDFNALKVIVESEKLDLSEPLVFNCDTDEHFDTKWNVVVVDPAGLAMLIDSGTDIDDPTAFVLLKTEALLYAANGRSFAL